VVLPPMTNNDHETVKRAYFVHDALYADIKNAR
jgi:hypothetical protein